MQATTRTKAFNKYACLSNHVVKSRHEANLFWPGRGKGFGRRTLSLPGCPRFDPTDSNSINIIGRARWLWRMKTLYFLCFKKSRKTNLGISNWVTHNATWNKVKVARNEVENASFAQRSAQRDSRIWRPELIEPAAERKRRARGRRPTFKSAYPDPQILPQYNISSNYPLLGKCKALWGKPRTLLRLSQRSTELSCTRFDAERSKKSKAIDEQRCGTFLLREHISPRTSSTLVRVQVVGVCEVHTLAGMPGLVIVLDPACACQWERRRTVKKG